MKKVLTILIFCFVMVMCIPIGFAANDDLDEHIYEAIRFDYCYITNLSEEEANNNFAQIKTNYDSTLTKDIERNYLQLDSENNLENTILYLQENYDNFTSTMSNEERNKINLYFLNIALQYYNENYDEQMFENTDISPISDAPAVQPEDSLITGININDFPNNLYSTSASNVAKVTIFSDPSSSIVGSSGLSIDAGTHSWIVVENLTNSSITVGKMVISQGTQIAVGTWGNQTEHTGIWYNLEPYLTKYDGAYSGRVSTSCTIDSNKLQILNSYISSHDLWTNNGNCSSFASSIWNSISDTTLSAGVIHTPKNLANSIINTRNYSTNVAMRYFYRVHYANGVNTPIQSSVYTNTQ